MTDLAAAIRNLLTYSRSVSLVRTDNGKWQCNARTPHSGYSYSVYIHEDPIQALLATCNRAIPPTNPYKCNACDDTGYLHGEIGVTCHCRKPVPAAFSLPGLPSTPVLPGMPGWKP